MPIDQSEFNSAMATYLAATDHTIALRRGLASALPSGLLLGEPYYATDTERLHVGHGDGTNIGLANKTEFDALAAIANQPNLIMNGGFDVNQRGTSASFGHATLTRLHDRWFDYADNGGGTLPILIRSVLSGFVDGNLRNYSRLAYSDAGASLGASSIHLFPQKIEHGTRQFAGLNKKVTVSFLAKSNSTSKKIGIFLNQDYGTGGSPSAQERISGTNFTLTANWAKYTHTFTLNTLIGKTFGANKDDFLELSFVSMWGSIRASDVSASTAETYGGNGTTDIANVCMGQGDVAMDFVPERYDDVLRKCRRYCVVLPNGSAPYAQIGYGFANLATSIVVETHIKSPLRVVPTISYSGNFQVSDGAAGTAITGMTVDANGASQEVIPVVATVAGGLTQFRPYRIERQNNASALITLDAEL